jgi:hypothetical protein
MSETLHVVVDGSNICFDPSGQAHFHRLMSISESIRNSFSRFDVNIKIFTDASLRYRFRDEARDAYNVLISTGRVSQVPAGTQADPFILSWAEANSALVVSNDLFRGFEAQYPWLTKQDSGRVLSHLFDEESDSWTFIERGVSVSPRNLQEIAEALVHRTAVLPPEADEVLPKSTSLFGGGSISSSVFDPVNMDSTPQYRARVDQNNPTAFIFLVDQSASMAEIWENEKQKMVLVADFLNELILSLVLASTKVGKIVPYFDIAVLGYGGGPIGSVRSLLPKTTFDTPFRKISEIAASSKLSNRFIDGEEVEVETWIEPLAEGNTPMCAALRHAKLITSDWVRKNPKSFPPIVFNITDGESTDGPIREIAADLCDLSTIDGNVMLWTAHITNQEAGSFQFPVLLKDESDSAAVQMFESSSLIPLAMRLQAGGLGLEIPNGGRALLFNACSDDVIRMLNIGTQATRLA